MRRNRATHNPRRSTSPASGVAEVYGTPTDDDISRYLDRGKHNLLIRYILVTRSFSPDSLF